MRLGLAERFPGFVQTTSGVLAIVLGLVVIIGWQAGSATLTQVRSASAPMQYVNALAFVIAGVSLLAAVTGRDWVSGIAGLLTGVIGLMSLTQDLLSVDSNQDLVFGVTAYVISGAAPPGRMASNAAVCVTFVGAALFLRRAAGPARVSTVTGLLGSATAALGLVALVGHASDLAPAYGWGRLTRMSVHTAAGFVIVGSGLVSRGWRDSPHGGGYRAPALVGVASLTATIAVWHALLVHDRQRASELISTQASYWKAVIAQPIDAQAQALEEMAYRWARPPAGVEEWTEDATRLMTSFPACRFVERIDWDAGERWALPDHAEAALLAAGVRDAALRAGIARRSTTLASERNFETGNIDTLVVVPTLRRGPVGAGLVAVVGIDTLVERALASHQESGYGAAVFDGVRRIYGTAPTVDMPIEWVTEVDIMIRGARFRLQVWPTPARLAQLEGRMASLILGGGLLLSAVLACTTSFAGTARRRERELRDTAHRLREQIEERRVAETALRASEERYRTLVDSAHDIIYRVDPSGRFTFVNPVATRVMDRTQSELMGLDFLELIAPDWRTTVAEFYADQVKRRVPHTYFEFPAIAAKGEIVWIGQNVQLLASEDRATGLQAVARNITERKRVDAEIARARDAALESDRLKSEFVANVSHELRTPLNGILGMTELLLETNLTSEQRDRAGTAHDCAETLLALLNDILDLSKVAAGKLEIQAVTFEPRHLVKQTVDLFSERARRKGVDLVCLVQHDVPEVVLGDPSRCRQVLTNLLGNAVKFTDQGNITVHVSSEHGADAAIMLRVEVADTGIGIAADAQARLFQPFVQADGSITRRYGGTGLGLVISRQLVALMEGEMGMTSQPGEGSVFWFTVRVMSAKPQRPAPSDADLKGRRVLTLDDSENSRRRLRSILESWQMSVVEEAAPDTALRTLRAAADAGQPFDVVLVDLRDPVHGALDFAEVAHQDGLVPPTRLVLMNGRGEPGDAQRAQQHGACAYLTKPIASSELLDCLNAIMAASCDVQSPAESARLVTRHSLAEDRSRQRHELVLVVEDNVVNQKVLVGLLASLGCRADVANNGIEALDALTRTRYSLVLMDSQMPLMDGFATTAEIRRREGDSRRTVVVAVTAHALQGERERCLAAGMDDYLSKPVSRERLSAILDRWLVTGDQDAPIPAPDEAGGDRCLDPTVIAELRALEADAPGIVAEVLSTFLQETPRRIARIVDAIDRMDSGAAEQAAHGLKGSAAAVGAMRLAGLCARIEASGRDGALTSCRSSAQTLDAEFRQVRTILEQHYVAPGAR